MMMMSNHIRLLNKALLYVFGKRYKHIVSVTASSDCYQIKCEYADRPGTYYIVEESYTQLNGLDQEIDAALHELTWQQEGGEFPN